MKSNLLSEYLYIKKSRIGKGLFSNKTFSTDESIYELKGKLITCFEDDDLDEKIRSNTIRYSSEYFLSPEGELGDYLNHSCVPNSYIYKKGKKLYLKAADDISIDEEITIDYSTIIASDDLWEMKCHCQTSKCRGFVKSIDKLPKKIRDNYLSRNMVPSYIYEVTNKKIMAKGNNARKKEVKKPKKDKKK